jgi:hypothetical protein
MTAPVRFTSDLPLLLPFAPRYLIYANVCRSLFERHKLLFSFLLTTRIMAGDGSIDPLEWRFLISGQSPRVGACVRCAIYI